MIALNESDTITLLEIAKEVMALTADRKNTILDALDLSDAALEVLFANTEQALERGRDIVNDDSSLSIGM